MGKFTNKSGSRSPIHKSNEGMILTQFDGVGGGSPLNQSSNKSLLRFERRRSVCDLEL